MKYFYIILLILTSTHVNATSGGVKNENVIKIDETYYGFHGADSHCHIVYKKDDKYYAKEKVDNSFCENITKKYEKYKIYFSSCVDGDTAKFIINNQEKTVRFLAVDTQESVSSTKPNTYMGKKASTYTCNMLKNAKLIELEEDPNSDKTDKYNRILGWIYVDNNLFQELLIKKGYAKTAYLYGNYKYTALLKEKEEKAKKNALGIWNDKNYIAKIYDFVQKIIKIFT